MSKLHFCRSISRLRHGRPCYKKNHWIAQSKFFRFCSTNVHRTAKPSPKIKWFWMPAGFGFALISFIQLRHIRNRERRRYAPSENEVSERGISSWQVDLFKVLPTKVLSRCWGKVHNIDLPTSLRGPVVRLWTWAFGCCLDEAEETDPSKYQNLGAFFTRKLKQGAREIDQASELVCPVDGRVLHFGQLIEGKLEQVKGIPYSLERFLGPNSTLSHYSVNNDRCLYQCVLYLGPGDCHHFHSPTEWHIKTRQHFSGELFSVSPWVLKGFRDVFCSNERVVLHGNWKYGSFTMTAVGAYNVGSINICFDNELKTNQTKKGQFNELSFGESIALSRGDHIGWFAMGSAVVLIFEGPKNFEFMIRCGDKVKLGQPLGLVTDEKL